jgi:hypothetical protein
MTLTKTGLWDAERLALFSNARETEAQHFREQYDNYFPRSFWNWQVPPLETGASVVTMSAANAEAVRLLRRAPPVDFWQAFQQVLRHAWQNGFPLEECVRLISCAAVADRLFRKADVEPDLSSYPVWPYQHAVMFLAVEPWRARFCGQCGKRFVADKPARRFCSSRCSAGARKTSRSVSWSKHGEKWRETYETKRAKGKSTKRTKR